MNGLIKWTRPSLSLERLEQVLERERRPPAPSVSAPQRPGMLRSRNMGLPPRVDLLRVCAQHGGNPWAAVYLLNANGGYDYSTSIVISKTLLRSQYAPTVAEQVIWNDTWIDEETCALCGVSSRGPIRCGSSNCRQLVCAGRSTGQFFRCFCGAEGWIQNQPIEHLGVIPQLAR